MTSLKLAKNSSIYDLDFEEVSRIFKSLDEPAYRARQLWRGLYSHYWNKPGDFTTFSKSLRSKLDQFISFSKLSVKKTLLSSDRKTEKTLFSLPDKKLIETVLMQYRERNTICVSTQAGCGMGCTFCATGQMGFRRNLTSGEIVEQVLYYARRLVARDERITNVVLMGMGEPFHNYKETMSAIDRLNHPEGFNMGARRFTISTVGLVPMIQRFTKERRQINLAVSLHAADDELRNTMLPINLKYPLNDLFNACKEYVDKTSRRITFEWALIKEVNDSIDQANKLAAHIKDMIAHVNLIPLNPTEGYKGIPSTRERASIFKATLDAHGIPCTIRLRRGIDIQAGCGQLAGQNDSNEGYLDKRY